MPEMINGVPACYGCIETNILRSGDCLRCDHVEGCKQYAANLKKYMDELLRHRLRR